MGSQLLKRVNPVAFRRAHSLSLCSAASDEDDVVSSVASILTTHRAKSRWPTILNHCPRGLTPLQASNVLLRVRHNPNLAAAFFRFTSENTFTSHDLHSFSTIIHILARARKNTRALTLMRTAILAHEVEVKPPALFVALVRTYESCDSSPLVFGLLLRAYLDLNRLDSCLYMLKTLPSNGLQPSLTTCNRLVSLVARHRGVAIGFDLYRDLFGRPNLPPPNAATFNRLLAACFRERVPDKAQEILMEMRRLNCDPNCKTCNILLAVYCEQGAMVKATELWEEMKSKGVAREIVAYNTLIARWCKIGDAQAGEELYNEMKMAGIQANYVTYQHLIIGHCKFGDVSSACLLFEEMCGKGMVSQALQVFRQVTKDADFGARRSTYESLIKGLCGNGEMEKALKLQAEMVGKGFEPDHSIYAAFVDGHTKLGKLDTADKLREEMNPTLGLRGD